MNKKEICWIYVIQFIFFSEFTNSFAVDELIIGQVLTGGLGQNPARQAAIRSGLPKEVPAYIVNQVCGSGLRSIALAFQGISIGEFNSTKVLIDLNGDY